MKTNNQIFKCNVEDLQIHPEVEKTYQEKKTPLMEMTMKNYGQQQQISVVIRDSKYYIVDGVTRFKVAKQIGIETLNCIELEITDKEIIEYRIRLNQKAKKGIIENRP